MPPRHFCKRKALSARRGHFSLMHGRGLDSARAGLSAIEKEHERATSRIAAIDENLTRLGDDETETRRSSR